MWLWTWTSANARLVQHRCDALRSPSSTWACRIAKPDAQAQLPWQRRWMGDLAIEHVLLGTWASDTEFNAAERLFPEAKVVRNDPFWQSWLEDVAALD